MELTIRKLENNVYDLFTGKGWNDFARIKIVRNKCIHLAGNHIPFRMKKALASTVLSDPKFKPNYQTTYTL